jgi:hypothetical protein
LFPEDERAQKLRCKMREDAVAHEIVERFGQRLTLVFDRVPQDYGGCTRYRPDIWVDFGPFVLIVECDEHMHTGAAYSCDLRRMTELWSHFGKRLCSCASTPMVTRTLPAFPTRVAFTRTEPPVSWSWTQIKLASGDIA